MNILCIQITNIVFQMQRLQLECREFLYDCMVWQKVNPSDFVIL